MVSTLKSYINNGQTCSNDSSVEDNGGPINELKFDFSRIAIISVHGDPGDFFSN